ncbi:MAG: hypothetical protein M4579_006886 [Chaenotheca gracillima]|nr:MAG: hypothetical protein M4579_006886 [Chaenotheca gracillima]
MSSIISNLADQNPVRPRKRRRPAQSCVECRRRKIKCDRGDPCEQCTQSKSSTCTYSRYAVGSESNERDLSRRSSKDRSSAKHHERLEASYLSPASLPSPAQGSDTLRGGTSNATTNQFASPGPSPRTAPIVEAFDSSENTGPPGSQHLPAVAPPGSSVEDLLNRVHTLEKRLSEATGKPVDAPKWPAVPIESRQHMPCTLSKTRIFGQSHWMSSLDVEQFEKICSLARKTDTGETRSSKQKDVLAGSEVHRLIEKCKTLVKVAKASQSPPWPILPDFKELVPARDVADHLVHLYFRTHESTYRILHRPSFYSEYARYWESPRDASTGFVVKLLLVMAIGACFYEGPEDQPRMRDEARQWICMAHSWISTPYEKIRLHLTGLQIHCLLLIARQTNSVGGKWQWASAGSLLRDAMQMGFHRDPRNYPKMSALHAEIRKRLWATVLELTVQTSLDAGMPPLISLQDFDTEPPSNINDDEVDDTTKTAPVSKPSTVFTETSLQLILSKSLRARLEIVQAMNGFRAEPSYDHILSLSAEVTRTYREYAPVLFPPSSLDLAHAPSAFHRNLLDLLIQRFILGLHRPFANKASKDPRFYFSRKICLESALTISSPEADPDFSRMMVVGGGPYREIIIRTGVSLFLELVTQLEEDSSPVTLQRSRQAREPLHAALRTWEALTRKRVENGENNVKGHCFMSMAMGQIDAMENNTNVMQGISEAAQRSTAVCYELLKARVGSAHTTPADSGGQRPHEANEDGSLGGAETQGYGIDLLLDGTFDLEIPDSWLFPGWE